MKSGPIIKPMKLKPGQRSRGYRPPVRMTKEQLKKKLEKIAAMRLAREARRKHPAKPKRKIPFCKPCPETDDGGNYRSFRAWVSAVKRAGGTPNSQLSEPQGAFNRSTGQMVGEWDGFSGSVYRRNPVLPRKGESERKFVSRCMSEEKMSFPKQKQRIAVCLSKARKNPLLESGATISRNSGINRRAASMT